MFNSDGRVSHHRSFALFPFFLSVFFFFLLLFQIGRGYFSLDLIFVPGSGLGGSGNSIYVRPR